VIRGELAKLWLEWNYDNNTESTKPEHKNRVEKIENRLEMFVHNGHVRVVTWRVAA
jgi:hypothetical protein